MLAWRRVDRSLRSLLLASGLAMAGSVVVFAGVRPSLTWSAAVFALLGFLAGIRTLTGSALGLAVAGDDKVGGMGLRRDSAPGPRSAGERLSARAPALGSGGGQGRGRTADLPIFSRTLYQLSYLTGPGWLCDRPGSAEPGRVECPSGGACRGADGI